MEMMISKVSGSSALGMTVGAVFFALSDAVSIAIVANISAVIMAGVAAYFAYKAKVISETTKDIAQITAKAVDGHLTEFKQMAKDSFTAEGVLQEKAEEKVRQADAVKYRIEGVIEERSKHDVVPIIKETVKEAVVESVKEPVKEAVLETGFTDAHIEEIVAALRRKKP